VEDNKGMLNIAVNYYKALFCAEDMLDINLADDFWDENDIVSNEQNLILDADFTEKEVKKAVFSSYADGAPSPDGFPFLFYQKLWDLIKPDLMEMVNEWNRGNLDLFRLNFSLLTLIPKEADAVTIQKFRPVALTNCNFKIFSKCITNRLCGISDALISQNQIAFLKGRYILEYVVAAHEIIHDVAYSDQYGFVFKLDYEKTYDRVDSNFLIKMMQGRGFSSKWIKILCPYWIEVQLELD
jgi:hypothetical protein